MKKTIKQREPVMNLKPDTFPKLSEVKLPRRFAVCRTDRLIFENDINTQHAPCPTCHAWMENITEEAARNLKKQYDLEIPSV